MDESHIIQKVDINRWEQAQEFELKSAEQAIGSDDDWNKWWYEKFEEYSVLKSKHYNNVLEVGCGPHTNVRYILPSITFDKLWFEDPLIQFYITHNLNGSNSYLRKIRNHVKKNPINYLLKLYSDKNMVIDLSSSKLEDLPYKDQQMDLIICINVLDHVNDFKKCMEEIFRVLKNGGLLVLGQDLSNKEDQMYCPESYEDIGHPIKIDHLLIEKILVGKYHPLFEKILTRDEGRNPKAHYATYLGILQKETIQ